MQFKKPRGSPEKDGTTRLRKLMIEQGWYVKKTHGSMYSDNWPDLYALHPRHGQRWIEMKTACGVLSTGQVDEFGKWSKFGMGVWCLRDENDYQLLFQPPNWYVFSLPMRQRPL